MAINQPDRFAWHLFTIINKPVADDPFQRVAWEKWALARDVFINPLKAPGWEELEKDPRAEEKLDGI